jgi:hypothetical protein
VSLQYFVGTMLLLAVPYVPLDTTAQGWTRAGLLWCLLAGELLGRQLAVAKRFFATQQSLMVGTILFVIVMGIPLLRSWSRLPDEPVAAVLVVFFMGSLISTYLSCATYSLASTLLSGPNGTRAGIMLGISVYCGVYLAIGLTHLRA